MALFCDPKKILDQCGIQVGQVIADFGSGSGVYCIEASKALMSTGKVYAIDVQKDVLVRLQNDARSQNLSNTDIVCGDVEKVGGTKIREASVDLVFMCTILFQLEDKKSALLEAKRILVPGGRVLVVDWTDSFGGIGPHKNDVVSKEKVCDLFEKAGFSQEREISAGSHHYGFIFKKM